MDTYDATSPEAGRTLSPLAAHRLQKYRAASGDLSTTTVRVEGRTRADDHAGAAEKRHGTTFAGRPDTTLPATSTAPRFTVPRVASWVTGVI
jgi:hypothetical protein